MARDRIDAFWSATGLLPVMPRGIPSCLTVQDLNSRMVPQTMSRLTRIAFSLFFEADMRAADMLLAGSKGTAYRMLEYYGLNVTRIVPSGVSSEFKAQPREAALETCARYGLHDPFCLAVGTIEPRKNILNLLQAFDMLDRKGTLGNYKLALVGKAGWQDKEIQKTIENYEGRWLRRLGFVPDADLAKLYSATALFVFPSIYEGFGIPVIEALSCGAPVAVTDIPELREYCGPDAVLIPGTRAEDIAAALEPTLRDRIPQGSITHALPMWQQAAEITKQSLCELMHNMCTVERL